MKTKNRYVLCAAVLCLAFGWFLFMQKTQSEPLEGSIDGYMLAVRGEEPALPCTAQTARQDAQALIEAVERIHPMFAPAECVPEGFAESVPEGYEQARQRFLEDCSDFYGSWDEFLLASQRFLTVLSDQHTRNTEISLWLSEKGFLSLSMEYADGKLWRLDDEGQRDGVVVSLGGVDTERVLAAVSSLLPAENQNGREKNYERYCGSVALLEMLGAEGKKVTVSGTAGGEQTLLCTAGGLVSAAQTHADGSLAAYREGGALVLRMGTCMLSTQQQQQQLGDMLETLRAYLDEGGSQVVLDVRGNGGGSSAVWMPFWQEMGMDLRGYFVRSWSRPSAELDERAEYLDLYAGVDAQAPEQGAQGTAGSGQPRCRVAVLCDGDTASAAQDLCYAARGWDNAVVVGTPPSNAPDSYTDIVLVCLPCSKQLVQISTKHIMPADSAARGDIFEPDIETGAQQDALDAALAWLSQPESAHQ